MRPLQLVHRSLLHYWRTNLAVIAGVAVAVAVLAGALLVGESVRASLRELAVGRLGRTDHLVASTQFFRRALVEDLMRQQGFASCCASAYALIAVDGLVARPESGAGGDAAGGGGRAGGVAVYGIDEDFWKFHGRPSPGGLRPREAWLSPALARELGHTDPGTGPGAGTGTGPGTASGPGSGAGAGAGATADASAGAGAGPGRQGGGVVLLRLQQPSAVPLGTLHGRRDESGTTIRLTVRGVLSADAMGEFSLRPRQGDVRAIFVPIARLQADLNQPDRANAILIAAREGAASSTAMREGDSPARGPAGNGSGNLAPGARDGATGGAGDSAARGPAARGAGTAAAGARGAATGGAGDSATSGASGSAADALASGATSSATSGATSGGPAEAAGGAAGGDAARAIERLLARSLQLEDAGLKTRSQPNDAGFILESDAGLLTDAVVDVAQRTAAAQRLSATPVLTYLAHTIRSGDREVPYSVVSAIDLDAAAPSSARPADTARESAARPADAASAASGQVAPAGSGDRAPIWFNAWTADALQVKPGASVTLEYDVWEDAGGLVRRQAAFTLAGVLPMTGVGADATLTPEYPGITGEESLSDWDPPFPLDLSRITKRDEDYWDRYRAAPKAFVRLADGQRLWGSRFGKVTSLRIAAADASTYRQALQAALTPATAGLVVQPVRATALAAASGTTDFGEYFLYFSFFIVVSGLLLAGLFFRLGVEQRVREVGLLQALGFRPALVSRLFLIEGAYLAVAGSVIGVLGAIGYAALIMLGLRTWWVGAVGTTALTLRPSAASLLIGAVAGVITAVLAIAWTLRGVTRVPARTLLHGDLEASVPVGGAAHTAADRRVTGRARRRRLWFIAALVLAIGLTLASAVRAIDQTAGFFGAGGAALVAALYGLSLWLHRAPAQPTPAPTLRGLWRFGQINAAARPGRTVLSVALIAFATFVIVTVGAFRQEGVASPSDPKAGTGGYLLMAESVAPIVDDPNTPAGRAALGLDSPDVQSALAGTSIARFRVRPGDDGSCLNLYRPENPRVIAPTEAFVTRGGRFTFASSLAETEAERANPWLLLNRTFADGAVPAIVDLTSLMYVFHKSLGDDIILSRGSGPPVALRIVGALSHSVFQSELIVGEPAFVRLFPGNEGYRLFMIEAADGDAATNAAASAGGAPRVEIIGRTLENRLADFGVEAIGTVDRLRAYQQVENTYLSTFQALGALGLVLGTLGVGTVLLRNILERRREIALLQAIGYRHGHVRNVILAESVSLVVWGLAAGAACALLAVLPAIVDRGGQFPWTVMIALLAAVIGAGCLSSIAATSLAVRLPLLASLRAE